MKTDASIPLPCAFRARSSRADSAISGRFPALCVFIEVKSSFASFLIRAFPCVATVLCPRLTSASRCEPSPARLRVRGGMQTSPGNAHDFRIYAWPIYLTRFRTGFGLCVLWPACPRALPHIGFLFVRPMFCYGFLQIPPRGGHPCRSLWRSPCRAASGLPPVSRAPCRAHHKNESAGYIICRYRTPPEKTG